MRGKLVVVEASGVVFESLFVYGVLRVTTQRCVRAESPDPTWSTPDGFYRSPTVRDP